MKQESKGINLFILFILGALMMVFVFTSMNANNRKKDYTRAQFLSDMEAGKVEDIEIQLNSETPTGGLYIQMKNGEEKILFVADIVEMENIIRENGFDPKVYDVERDGWFLTTMVPLLVVIVIGFFLFMLINAQNAAAGAGNAKMMNFGKSRAKLSTGEKKITFEQVAGLKEEKEDLEEIVDFLKNPGKYNNVGARIPKGVLLEGPPGTGKTLLAKAVAGEAGVAFFSISGSDFVEMYVGVGESRVRDLFEQAKKNAVYAVIFQGIRNGADKGCDMRPLVTEVNAREKYEEYFDRFFKDGGEYSKYVTKEDEKKRSKDKVKTKTFVVRVITVRVLRTQLKNRLKGDGII